MIDDDRPGQIDEQQPKLAHQLEQREGLVALMTLPRGWGRIAVVEVHSRDDEPAELGTAPRRALSCASYQGGGGGGPEEIGERVPQDREERRHRALGTSVASLFAALDACFAHASLSSASRRSKRGPTADRPR